MTSLSIINRKDCCGGRLKNIEVRAGISPNASTNELIGRITGPGVTGDVHALRLRTTLFVQYIKFQLIGEPGWLTINGVRLNRQPALDRTSFICCSARIESDHLGVEGNETTGFY